MKSEQNAERFKVLRILVAGNYHSRIHEEFLCRSFKELGNEVYEFRWSDYFESRKGGHLGFLKTAYKRFQSKFITGPSVWQLNKDLLILAKRLKPDLVFIYRGTHVYPRTVKGLHDAGFTVFGYNNDDPFGTDHPAYMWRYFLGAAPYYDHVFAYRKKNIEEYRALGCRATSLLRGYYVKELHFRNAMPAGSEKVYDAVFVGHYEDDGRDLVVKSIIESGVNFRLYGPEWRRSKYYEYFKARLGEVAPVPVGDYAETLSRAKIALVFLSKLNNDSYTRRVFEIPAAGTFMLAQYTADLVLLFKDGEEAVFFRNQEDLISKIRYYLKQDDIRERIARAGQARLLKDGHEAMDRAKQILDVYYKGGF